MNEDWMGQMYRQEANAPALSLGEYTAKTFGWMFAGLMVTFLVAFSGYRMGWILMVAAIPGWFYLLFLAEIGVVIFMSARVHKIGTGTAKAMFFLYAGLNGIVFSMYFLIFDLTSMILVFGATSLFFGIMALMGRFLNLDFSRIRPFMTAGLIFLAVFWLLSMFINLSRFETIACMLGIFLFLGYTAYDTHKIKETYAYYGQNSAMLEKASIFSALELYLDFINLFIYLLRVLGRRK